MNYLLNKTSHTPLIKFENGALEISGRSIPEDTFKFFDPFIELLEEYIKKPLPITVAKINLEYSNSSSNRSLLTIFELLEKLYFDGYNVTINWYYIKGDQEMFDLGDDFRSLIKIPFNFIEKETRD